jgi:tetratricopeptide (TPR) repeat protein
MQIRHLIATFQIIYCAILFGCEINPILEDRLNLEVLKVNELVYANYLVEAEQEISKIDTTSLDDINKGAYHLAKAFLYHELGNRALALSNMSEASELISSSGNDYLKAELSLINGFIFEQLILRSEALKSYFQAYDYNDKLFYTLLGIARTYWL